MVGASGIDSALAHGDIVRVLPGLYAATEHSESWAVRSRAASTWSPRGSALTGLGALFEWGLIDEVPDVVDLVVPRGCHRRGPRWMRVVSQTAWIDRHETADGAFVAAPELALIHAFGRVPVSQRPSLVYRAMSRRELDAERLMDQLDRLPRTRGRPMLVRLVARAHEGIESFLEDQGARRVLTGAPFVHFIRQHWLTVGAERFRADAFDPVTRTVFEFDGGHWHSKPEQRMRDIRRDALLLSIGIATVRFGYRDVMDRPGWCRAIALRVMSSRAELARVA